MSTPGEQLPQFPVPSEHDAFLASLEQRELVELGNMFSEKDTPWRLVFKQERLTRERAVEDIKFYVPPAESPAYDPEAGPEGYMEQVRRLNMEVTLNYGALPLKQERQQLRQIAERYVSNYPDISRLTWNAARLSRDDLVEFFQYNLRGIAMPSRMVGLMAFESQKRKTVRRYMPDIRISAGEVRYQIRDQHMTRADIEAAEQAVLGLPHTTPLPDFFQMTTEQQGAIVAALGAEWRELCTLMASYDPGAFKVQVFRLEGALSSHPVARLREAIEQNPSIDPGKICRFFLRRPSSFESVLQSARAGVEREKQLRAQREARRAELAERQGVEPGASPTIETRAMSENMRELERLTSDPDVKDDILDAAYGEEVPLTETDRLLVTSKFDDIAAKHTELIGRAIWELMPDKSTSGVRFGQHGKFSVGSALRGKHIGYMRNLTVTRVPVTVEEMAAELKEKYNPLTMTPENATRLIFLAEIKPTGRVAQQTYLSMILTVTRSPRGRDVIEMNRHAARATGADVALSLRMDSEARARAAEVRSWKAPGLRGGLPSVGRHETSTQQKR